MLNIGAAKKTLFNYEQLKNLKKKTQRKVVEITIIYSDKSEKKK